MAVELKADPRTGLEIIDIPTDHEKYFNDLKGCLIHWFGVVDKYNRVYKIQKRICIISDQCVYLCRTDASITRCVSIQAIQELVLTDQSAIGFRVGPPDFDLLIAVENVQERENIVHIVSKVYWNLVGTDINVRRLSGDSGEAVSQNLQLTKPKGWQPNITPMKTVKALTKLMLEKQAKEDEDRRVVQEEFDRIKQGLRAQLEQYRSEEYDRMVDQLSQYVKALEEKDGQIAKLKENSVSLDDPEVWKKCPNCSTLRTILESHPNDDKQKVLRLEREIESQRHIVEHLQAAIQHRTGNRSSATESTADNSQVVVMKQELTEATRKNKELQQLILDSPYLTSEVKNRASRMAVGTQQAASQMGSQSSTGIGGRTSIELQEGLAEKDREIRHLKSVLRDSTFRQVQELESIRTQFQQYDNQIVEYLEKVFSGKIAMQRGGTARQMAAATAEAAKQAVTSPAASAIPKQSAYGEVSSSSPFRQFAPSPGGASPPSASRAMASAPASYDIPAARPHGGGGGFTPAMQSSPQRPGGMWGS